MDKSRSDFEKWWVVASGLDAIDLLSEFDKDESGNYIYGGADIAWRGWQASREAPIDLTNIDAYASSYDDTTVTPVNEVKRVITEAGYKFKE